MSKWYERPIPFLFRLVPKSQRSYLEKHLSSFRLFYLILLFDAVYELVNRPWFTQPIDVKLPIDDRLPFVPELIVVYHSWMPLLLVFLYLLFRRDLAQFRRSILSCVTAQFVGYGIYICCQTVNTIRVMPEGNDIFSAIIRFTYSIDHSYNCCPSMHVTLSTILCLTLLRAPFPKVARWIFGLYQLVIMASTVLLDQHLVVDIVAGWVFGLLIWLIVGAVLRRWGSKHSNKAPSSSV